MQLGELPMLHSDVVFDPATFEQMLVFFLVELAVGLGHFLALI